MNEKIMIATIKYCCADVFKRLYGKYIRSVKRQFGKKAMENITIECIEKELPEDKTRFRSSSYKARNCCFKCYKEYRNKDISSLKEMKIIIRVPNEIMVK